MADRRRFGVIEVEQVIAETYDLTINGELWSEVEWSGARQCWCVQDAAGQCLSHVEHVVEQNQDVQTAIRLAKRMIVDGRMPTPEEARAQLKLEQERERLGEPLPAEFPERQSQAVAKPRRVITCTNLHQPAPTCISLHILQKTNPDE